MSSSKTYLIQMTFLTASVGLIASMSPSMGSAAETEGVSAVQGLTPAEIAEINQDPMPQRPYGSKFIVVEQMISVVDEISNGQHKLRPVNWVLLAIPSPYYIGSSTYKWVDSASLKNGLYRTLKLPAPPPPIWREVNNWNYNEYQKRELEFQKNQKQIQEKFLSDERIRAIDEKGNLVRKTLMLALKYTRPESMDPTEISRIFLAPQINNIPQNVVLPNIESLGLNIAETAFLRSRISEADSLRELAADLVSPFGVSEDHGQRTIKGSPWLHELQNRVNHFKQLHNIKTDSVAAQLFIAKNMADLAHLKTKTSPSDTATDLPAELAINLRLIHNFFITEAVVTNSGAGFEKLAPFMGGAEFVERMTQESVRMVSRLSTQPHNAIDQKKMRDILGHDGILPIGRCGKPSR